MGEKDKQLRSVLIIDDDVGFARSIADMLRRCGYQVCCIDSAERALKMIGRASARARRIAVVLTDLRLGGSKSGIDLIPALRAKRPELICVLMTTAIDSQSVIAALRRGAYDYFDKAWDPAALFAVLDRCFDRVRLQLEREAAYESLRLAKEVAETANRAKSAFLATLSHELRTPLNAILGFAEMMMNEVQGPLVNDHYRSYVGDIHQSGSHLLQIINDILDLSKAEAGRLELNDEVFDLREVIRSVRQLISPRLGEGELTDSVELPADLPLLRADQRKTMQVLLNLVSNAVKFTAPGGHIEITARFDPQTGFDLTVSDTGVGIAAADLARVLEPFEQIDSTFSRSHHGTGLGLPLVKAIVELHGGRLGLASEPGVGTIASVIFPPERAMVIAHPHRAA